MFITKSKQQREGEVSSRMEWIDQYRGFLVLFFIIAEISWRYIPLTPTFLMHGFQFHDAHPQMITLIDMGQAGFVLMLGFVGPLSFYKQLEKTKGKFPWKKFLIRITVLMGLMIMIGGLSFPPWAKPDPTWTWIQWRWMIFESTFATIFWCYICFTVVLYFLQKKPDIRFCISIGIFILHSILYSIPRIQNSEIITWNTLNNIASAIAGTCIFDWWFNYRPNSEDKNAGLKFRILPVAIISFCLSFLLNFLQPANYTDSTTSLSLLNLGTAMMYLFIFYNFSRIGLRVPILSELGRNMFLMVIIGITIHFLLDLIDMAYLIAHPFVGLLWIGIFPIAICSLIAWLLHKFKIVIKF